MAICGRRTTNVEPSPCPALDAWTDPPCNSVTSFTIVESQAEAAMLPRHRAVGLAEPFEDVREKVWCDANAGVGDAHRVARRTILDNDV